MYSRMDQGHILTAGFGVILIGFAGVSLLLGRDGLDLKFLHVGVYTPIIFVLYLVAMRSAFVYERRRPVPPTPADSDPDITLAMAVARYLAAAAVVVGAGTWLPFVGVEIADVMGWRTTFVGTLLIAGARPGSSSSAHPNRNPPQRCWQRARARNIMGFDWLE